LNSDLSCIDECYIHSTLFLFISVAELSTTLEEREIQYTKILQAADGKMDK